MGLIWEHFDRYKPHIERFLNETALNDTLRMVDDEFGDLMSSERRRLIRECLQLRHRKLVEAIKR